MKEDDHAWPEPDRVGRQELEMIVDDQHVSLTCTKLGSVLQVQQSKDPDGLRIFYYLVQVRQHAQHVRTRAESWPGSESMAVLGKPVVSVAAMCAATTAGGAEAAAEQMQIAIGWETVAVLSESGYFWAVAGVSELHQSDNEELCLDCLYSYL
eukprot:360101-Chlamydomonas_euryale.AAC.7